MPSARTFRTGSSIYATNVLLGRRFEIVVDGNRALSSKELLGPDRFVLAPDHHRRHMEGDGSPYGASDTRKKGFRFAEVSVTITGSPADADSLRGRRRARRSCPKACGSSGTRRLSSREFWANQMEIAARPTSILGRVACEVDESRRPTVSEKTVLCRGSRADRRDLPARRLSACRCARGDLGNTPPIVRG